MSELRDKANELSSAVIGAAIEEHRTLGPGLLESAYEGCLCRELSLREIPFQRQVAFPIDYKGMKVDCGYRIDLLIDNLVIVELKSVESVQPIHEAQLLTCSRLRGLWLGLLINFNVDVLKKGIKRLVNGQI